MSGGGRPRGSVGPKKRQQEADADDPTGSKRATRREHFFDRHFYVAHGSTASVYGPDVEKCDAVPGTTVNVGTLAATAPPLPVQVQDDIAELPQRRADRRDNTLYTYKGRVVRYQVAGHFIVCTCDGSSSCAGNQRLNRCCAHNTEAQTATLASRSKGNHDYQVMHSGTAVPRPQIKDKLHHGESELLNQGTVIGRIEDEVHGKAAGLVVLDDGRYDIRLQEFDDWTMTVHNIRFPLRPGLKWRKNFSGRHAHAVSRSDVTILFEVIVCNKTPERPLFLAKSLSGGISEFTCRSNCVQALERQWIAQSRDAEEVCRGVEVNGTKFLGFDNMNFAHHLRSITPDFLEAEDDVKDKVQVTRGSRKDDQCERQERRWASRMMSGFKDVLAQRGPDLESNFRLLMKSRFFQAEFGGLLDFEYSHCSPVIDGLVHEYKRAIGKHDSKMARHVLSHVAPFYTRWKVMMLFGCSEWAASKEV